MAVFRIRQKLTAEDLNDVQAYDARYARTAGTQAVANSTDVQVQFPTAVRTSSLVTASGTNNNAFTLAEGLWFITTTLRYSVSSLTTEISIAEGSVTWNFANTIASGSAGLNVTVATTVYVAAGTTKAVTVGTFQSSGGSINVVAFGASMTNINFTRVGMREG